MLALGALFRRHRMEIPPRLWLRLVDVANAELKVEQLNEWAEPGKRRRVLTSFLKAIGGELKSSEEPLGAPPPGSIKEEIAQMKAFAPQLARWIPVFKGPSPDDEFNRTYPTFIDRIVDLFETPGDDPQPRRWEAVKYRLMCLAWFFGCVTRLSDDDIVVLIGKAEETDGRLPFSILS